MPIPVEGIMYSVLYLVLIIILIEWYESINKNYIYEIKLFKINYDRVISKFYFIPSVLLSIKNI